MKAYKCENEDGELAIVYADKVGGAKVLAAQELDIDDFLDVKVHRCKWADEYGNIDNIPVKLYLEHGFMFECRECEQTIDENSKYQEGIIANYDYLCDECRKRC